MSTIIITLAVSVALIVTAAIAFGREIGVFESFVLILVVYAATSIIQRAWSRRRI